MILGTDQRRLPGHHVFRHGADLYQQSQEIRFVPHLDDLAVGNPVHEKPVEVHPFACRSVSFELAGMGAGDAELGRNKIALGDKLMDLDLLVWDLPVWKAGTLTF